MEQRGTPLSSRQKADLRPGLADRHGTSEELAAAFQEVQRNAADGTLYRMLLEKAQVFVRQIDPHLRVALMPGGQGLSFSYVNDDGSLNESFSFDWGYGGLIGDTPDMHYFNTFRDGAFEDKVRGAFALRRK